LALTGTVGLGFWQNLQEWISPPVLEAPAPIEVPDVTGQSLEEASGMLQDAGLTVDREHRIVESDKPEGTVLSTEPSAGSEVEAGTSVTLTVSRGTPKKTAEPTNTSTNSSAPKATATELNTPQTAPASAPASDPAPQQAAPQQAAPQQAAEEQPAPEQSTQDRGPVLQNRSDPQESAKEKAQEALERAQERAQEQIDKVRGDRE
jgi:serine/threonine-protein kinase